MNQEDDIVADVENETLVESVTPLGAADMDAVLARAKADAGAPFEPEALGRLAATKRAAVADYMRVRDRLKKEAAIKVSELDRAIDHLCRGGNGDRAGGDQQKAAIIFAEIVP